MLRKFVPRSLRAQMVLLTLGTILLVQAATFASLNWSWRKFTEEVAVDLTITTIHTLRHALAEIPSDQRADFVQQASDGQWHLWSRKLPSHTRLERRRQRRERMAERPPPPRDDIRTVLRSYVEAINERLDDDTRVALSHGQEPRLYISLLGEANLDTEPFNREWLVIPLDKIAKPIATPLVVMWLGGMGLLLLLAAAFSWHITRPLTKLARAADQLAAGNPQRVTPSGPTETRILSERFNAMLDTLAESNAVQRTLLAGLPHDLKGPLSRMWLRIEMIDDAAFKEGMRQDVQDMQRMIDQFIGYVRGSDPGSYQFQPMDLHAWLTEKVDNWRSAGSDVRLHTSVGGPLPVQGDSLALGRLIDNLITNALHHGKEPVEINLDADANTIWLRVSDHGPGISATRRHEALRPFSRLDDARTRTGSVGLGLALAELIAKAHNGTLELASAPGQGLQVNISLPRA
ncbi:MAG TPA: ATP-binding protein [Burkholderiaceae bacterium]|nr:ATP-binding protein [Burkholderiaceae bacterium]